MLTFNLTRMFLAVTAFAIVFSGLTYIGDEGIVAAIAGAGAAAVCLFVKPKEVLPQIRIGLVAALGALIGFILLLVFSPAYQGGQVGFFLLAGFIGLLVGIYKNSFRSKRVRSIATEETSDNSINSNRF